MIDLHYVPTPNGNKVLIMLEETGLPYNIISYDLLKGDHFTPAFRQLNPNNKLPVIVDHAPAFDNAPMTVFETGAILIYLAEKTARFLSDQPRNRMITLQWLMWQMAGLGPMHGQAHHFVRYAPDAEEYGVTRYTREARRLLAVLDYRLADVDYLAGDYSIADIAAWPWVQGARLINIDIGEYPHLKRWSDAVAARPAIQAIAPLPPHLIRPRMELDAEQWSNFFGERMLQAAQPGPAVTDS